MIKRLKALRPQQDESGVALIAVMLVMLILIMTTILITLTVMTTQGQTKTFNIHQQARATAESGINSFISSVNTSKGYTMLETYKTQSSLGAAQKQTPSNALCKTVEATVNTQIGYYPKWCTWTVKVASGTGTSGYYVYSKGFTVPTQSSTLISNPDDEVVIRVFVEPIVVDSVTTLDDGKVVYYMPSTAPFQLGISGTNLVEVRAGAQVYSNQFSRNSAPSGTDTDFVALASDDLIALPSSFPVGTLTAPANKSVTQICTPSGDSSCTEPVHRLSPVSTNTNSIAAAVNAKCPGNANTYDDWKASENGSSITSGCYNNITFDADMYIPAIYNENNPLEVFVKGKVTFESSYDVGLNRDPAAFQIRSVGAVLWINAPGASAALTSVKSTNAYIASSFSCNSVANTTRRVSINGALACASVVIGANTTVYMDTKSQQYGVDIINSAPANSVWFATGIEQL